MTRLDQVAYWSEPWTRMDSSEPEWTRVHHEHQLMTGVHCGKVDSSELERNAVYDYILMFESNLFTLYFLNSVANALG